MSLILASKSAIRSQMLGQAGVDFAIRAPEFDEDGPKRKALADQELALELACGKALSVPAASGQWVIGSDSLVSVNGRRFSKPRDRDEAAEHLRLFSGSVMTLTSAVALACHGRIDWSVADSADLEVRPLSERFIQLYLDSEWPAIGHCAGAFRIEGLGVTLFHSIQGNHFTILGMPLLPLLGALRERGLMPS